MSKIKLIEIHSDLGGRIAGASLGADAVRLASYSLPKFANFYERFQNELYTEIKAPNKFYHADIKYPLAKRIELIYPILMQICDVVSNSVIQNDFTLLISGDHSTASGTIAGIKQAMPNARIGIVWIDAHGDVHNPYTSDSGNLHGMPLSTAINDNNLDCRFNEIDNETAEWWEKVQEIGGTKDKINFADVVYVGLRDYEQAERYIINKYDCKIFKSFDVHNLGGTEVACQIGNHLEHCDVICISLDVDSLDPSVSTGTGTPFENGLYGYEVKELIKTLISFEKTKCLEISEINPILDTNNKMGKVAFDILKTACRSVDLKYHHNK